MSPNRANEPIFWRLQHSKVIISTMSMIVLEITPIAQKFFMNRIFQFLGKISYMLYLLHPITLYIGYYMRDYGYGLYSSYVCAMIPTIGLSYLLTLTVDKLSINSGDFVDRFLTGTDGNEQPDVNASNDYIALASVTNQTSSPPSPLLAVMTHS